MKFLLAILFAATVATASAAPPSTCRTGDAYGRALCAYQRREFAEAERALRAIADVDAAEPITMRANYFLARTLMKTGRFGEASAVFIRIYRLDKPFYDAWACDYLLGECRKAEGKG
ncbi:MAG: tetratricopeptide repeat protein [Thermoanaerobaculia bacterium]|nr:tetratricopeptide repeat protein [Thermoanaerobaculia bacterium]